MRILPFIKRERRALIVDGDRVEREGAWWSLFGPKVNRVAVTETSALKITTVFACVRIISETIASLPLFVYKRLDNGGKNRDPSHPLYTLLHDSPNPEMSAFDFWETITHWVLTWGNGYAEIERDGSGKVVALWPIPPNLVMPRRRTSDRQLVYDVTLDNGSMVTLPPEKILHFHGLGWDGRVGYSPIDMAREALSFAKATEIYGSNFFHQGGQPSGVLEMEGTLKDQNAADRLREQWMSIHGGVENSHRIAVLENGLKYKPISLPPNSAQFLETRKFQKADIAQMYRVPLHMINELDRATFSNIEHQSIEFVVHTIRPYLVRFEQELKRKLFVTNSDNRYFAEWLVDGLLRGDAKSRNEALQIQRQNGIINADEWREIENMNPIEDGSGKVYLVNSAMISIDQAMIPLNQRKGGEPSEGQGNQEPNGNSGNPQGSGGQTD